MCISEELGVESFTIKQAVLHGNMLLNKYAGFHIKVCLQLPSLNFIDIGLCYLLDMQYNCVCEEYN